MTTRHATLLLAMALLAPQATPAQSSTSWATAQGSGPSSFLDHGRAHDAAAGPNGTWATGMWTGAARKGSFTSFQVAPGTASVSRVEVLVHLYVTAPVTHNRLSLTLDLNGVQLGPLNISQAALNQHVGAGAAGLVSANFSLLHDFTAADLAQPLRVDIMCKRQGPDDGAVVLVDAVGLRISHPGSDGGGSGLFPSFHLRLSGDAASLAASAPLLTDVTSPVSVGPGACPEPICFLQILDGNGVTQPVTVGLMPDGQTVRVGFDDGQWAAPVSSVLSTVEAPAAPVAADGVSRARVRIVIRDAGGWPLGGKLALRLEPVLLGGAEVDGDILDLGNGIYFLHLVSPTPTTAVIALTVEGVPLADSPTVAFN